MEPYFHLVDQVLEKYKVPTKAIQGKVRDLANQAQLMISHSEFLKGNGKKQNQHLNAMKAAGLEMAHIMQQIQALAQIEVDKQ